MPLFAPNATGFDCESHRFRRGRMAPRMVCLTLYGRGTPPSWLGHDESAGFADAPDALLRTRGATWAAVFTGRRALAVFEAALDAGALLVGHNAPYDLAVLAAYAAALGGAKAGVAFLAKIFRHLDAGLIRDTMIRELLLAVAHGRTKFDPGLPPAKSGKTAKAFFDLATLVLRHFGQDISASKKDKVVDCVECEGRGWERVPNKTPYGPRGNARCVIDLLCDVCHGTGQVGPWRLRYDQLDGRALYAWPDDAIDYAIGDSKWAVLLHDAQGVPDELPAGIVVDETGHVTDEDAQLRAFFAMHLMSVHGVRTDPVAVEVLASEVEAVVEAGDRAAIEAGFVRGPDGFLLDADGDPTGKKGKPGARVMAVLYDMISKAYGGVPELTPSGRVKTDRPTLLGSGNPALVAYGESGEARKLLENYIPIIRQGTNRPITSRPVPVLTTGRTGWEDPSLQTAPRLGNYRPCFVARLGYVFVSADYDLAELCALAQIHLWMGLGDTLAERIRRGEDLHLSFAASMLGMDYAAAFEAYHNPAHPDHDKVAAARPPAKNANFALPGGGGAETFSNIAKKGGVDLSVEQAAILKLQWLADLPEQNAYFNYIGRLTGFGPTTIQQYVSGRVRGDVGFCDGCNTLFQGLVADGAKRAAYEVVRAAYVYDGGVTPPPQSTMSNAMFEVLDDLEKVAAGGEVRPSSPLFGCRPWVFLHDEIIMEAPDDPARMTAAADELSRVMAEVLQRYIPDVPITAAPAAMRRWYKGAKGVRDADGQLLVWEPETKNEAWDVESDNG